MAPDAFTFRSVLDQVASWPGANRNEVASHLEQLYIQASLDADDPADEAHCLCNLGRMWTRVRNNKKAMRYLEMAVTAAPEVAIHHSFLARSYTCARRWEDAERHFSIAMELAPHDAGTANWYRDMCARRDRAPRK